MHLKSIANVVVHHESTDNHLPENEATSLHSIRAKNPRGLIIAYLNINSIRNKFEFLKPLIADNVDVLTVAETKIDGTFTTSQFLLDGFSKPIRFDRNRHGGGLLIYVREGVPFKELSVYKPPNDIECGIIEISLKKQKWVLFSIYRPPSQSEKYFFEEIGKGLDFYSSKYESICLIGDFNCEPKENIVSDFMDSYNLSNLVKSPTCFKSDSPRCIDLILTNRKRSFQNTVAVHTGLSDFHAMIVTVLKGGYRKKGPKIIAYRNYAKFCADDFRKDLCDQISSELQDNEDYGAFDTVVTDTLNRHAPLKKKYLRANDGPFMTKALRKAMMHRKRLRNRYIKNRTEENLKAFKTQRNLCVKLLRKTKSDYYRNLDLGDLTDNRKFWKTVKPVFSNEVQINSSVTLIEDGKMITEDSEIAEIFSNYFANITESLGISEDQAVLSPTNGINDPIEKAIKKYENHPSIKMIKGSCELSQFEFKPVTVSEILLQIEKLNSKKASPLNSIPAKILKQNSDIFAVLIQKIFNSDLSRNNFPKELKTGEISSLFKSLDAFIKKNYRPITVLSSVSKIYERVLESQIKSHALSFLSPLLCGFREGYGTQHALVRLIETCKMTLDKRGIAAALLMDLSKAFDCLNHELLIAKLSAYGFSVSALRLIHSYLSERKQRVKINGSFSTWRETVIGVPQGSVLGPLLFNIYLNDLFMFVKDTQICNYADDTTIYASANNIESVIKTLESDALKITKWFPNNCMKLNEDKCHLMVFGDKSNNVSINIGSVTINESTEEKLLGVIFDKKLSFKQQVKSLCKKAGQKLHALSRISHFLDTEQLKRIMKAFILSQFNYCPLVWMFCDRTLNNKINHIHERALRITYKDMRTDFDTMLLRDNSVPLHIRNLQLLMTEVFKTKLSLNPSFMKDIFVEKQVSYGLRGCHNLSLPQARTTCYGLETISFLGCRLWQALPNDLKQSDTLSSFKRKIKAWRGEECNCRICRPFVAQVGFLS